MVVEIARKGWPGLLLGSVLAASALAASALAAEPPAAAEETWARGRLDARYVLRATPGSQGETDHDFTQDLQVEGGRGSWLRLEASGRLHEDVGGRPSVSTFHDIYDTYGEPVQGFLYLGYGEVLQQGVVSRLRIGRQYYGEGVEIRFDGGLVETEPLGGAVRLTAYGGSPVNLYEASRTGDWLAGGAAEIVGIPRTDARLDYVHVTDLRSDLEEAEETDGVPRDTLADDDYFQLAVTHRLLRELRLHARASTIEGRSSHVEGQALYFSDAIGLRAQARYTGQFGAYRDLSIEFSPFNEQLGQVEPYHEGYADVRKKLGEHLWLGAGGAVRELARDSDEGPYNHEFRRIFALADANDWPNEGLLVSLRGDLYLSDAEDQTFQGSLDITQELGAVTAGVGTSYAYFKFDEFFLEERENVRSYYANVEYKAPGGFRPRLSYAYEVDDEDEYHVVRLDARVTF